MPENLHDTKCWKKFFILEVTFFSPRSTPVTYGSSQARDRIRATAANLHHSHSNTRSKPRLQPTAQPRPRWILNPLSKARDGTCVLVDASQIHFCCTTAGTPLSWRWMMPDRNSDPRETGNLKYIDICKGLLSYFLFISLKIIEPFTEEIIILPCGVYNVYIWNT